MTPTTRAISDAIVSGADPETAREGLNTNNRSEENHHAEVPGSTDSHEIVDSSPINETTRHSATLLLGFFHLSLRSGCAGRRAGVHAFARAIQRPIGPTV